MVASTISLPVLEPADPGGLGGDCFPEDFLNLLDSDYRSYESLAQAQSLNVSSLKA